MSLLKIPVYYNVEITLEHGLSVVCTNHPKPRSLRVIPPMCFIGVDEIIRLIEEHQKVYNH